MSSERAAAPVRRVRARVSGRVQGVFYRATCADVARRMGLAGWVRNLPDGDVEAVAEGPAGDVEALLDWCRRGPPLARVERVDVSEEETTGDEGFRVLG